eukprot:2508689-Rhodomonas_salina.1
MCIRDSPRILLTPRSCARRYAVLIWRVVASTDQRVCGTNLADGLAATTNRFQQRNARSGTPHHRQTPASPVERAAYGATRCAVPMPRMGGAFWYGATRRAVLTSCIWYGVTWGVTWGVTRRLLNPPS